MAMKAYSFLDTQVSFTGPSGSFSLGAGSGSAEEGITVAMAGDKDTTTPGADGQVMHSLHASDVGTISIRFLKTSEDNALLQAAYTGDKQGSATWGQNIIQISNMNSGDVITGQELAFVKFPDLTYATEGGMVEWQLRGIIDQNLG
jgi:Protein of unknown function (DUF3277)